MEGPYLRDKSLVSLAISSIAKISHDSSSWKEPLVYRAILVSGLSVLVSSSKIVEEDLQNQSK